MQRGPFAGIADRAAAEARGGLAAQRLLFVLRRGEAGEEAVLQSVREVLASGEAGRLRGWARVIQKALEAGR